MKIYKIFLKKSNNGIIEDLELIKEGFNILAFVFQFFYLLYKQLWIQSLIIFLIMCILNLLQYNFITAYLVIPIQIGVAIYIGYEISNWLAKKLIKNGYELLGYTSGNDEKEAKLNFLEHINDNYSNNDKMEQKIF